MEALQIPRLSGPQPLTRAAPVILAPGSWNQKEHSPRRPIPFPHQLLAPVTSNKIPQTVQKVKWTWPKQCFLWERPEAVMWLPSKVFLGQTLVCVRVCVRLRVRVCMSV